MSFAKKMIELRKQQDLSQQDLADRLGGCPARPSPGGRPGPSNPWPTA